jgi:hypothetical protein
MKQKITTAYLRLAVGTGLALVLLSLAAVSYAQGQYILESSVIGSGLAAMANTEYTFHGTAGQPLVGTMTGGGEPSYGQIVGFWYVQHSVITGLNPTANLPAEFSLEQNYPNPFNPSTTIMYQLPRSSMVRLSVYDVLGREVAVLVDERKNAGSYEVKFDAVGLASGVYLYRLQAGEYVGTKKLLLIK